MIYWLFREFYFFIFKFSFFVLFFLMFKFSFFLYFHFYFQIFIKLFIFFEIKQNKYYLWCLDLGIPLCSTLCSRNTCLPNMIYLFLLLCFNSKTFFIFFHFFMYFFLIFVRFFFHFYNLFFIYIGKLSILV